MQRHLRLCYLALLFVFGGLVSTAFADERPCTAHDGDNYYDLSPLKSSKDYVFTSPTGEKFTVNVCKPAVSERWAMYVDRPEDVGGFVHRPRGDFSIGYTNTALLVRSGHPLLIMSGGSQCSNVSGMNASTAIRFICDTSVFGAGSPELVAQLPPEDESACAFFIEWRTHVACPTNERGGSWGFLVIIVAILGTVFMLYILVGTWYNRYVLELRGLDQIPRLPFSKVAGLFRDLVERVGEGSWRFGGWGHRGGGYSGLAEEQESMMGGPPGFLEEQDEEAGHGEGAGHGNNSSRTSEQTGAGAVGAVGATGAAGMDSDGVIRL